ncbi:LysR family transcriptional regulator [Pediococcus acidilactici]|uniref:LysR family transcriptional regulator n=1 Tax=Pediococcus acidilactici TaxID=1254 RepID=UPI00132C6031|nr:LysR family transcriptional regulator [Pediococcus acidilactici]KAF0364150.1 LysR family transcriptional regulator [Pediococcus acidilactici]KAF0368226.1 LysR family transcriptional regulator [Pediococcus acidilactici]KAF0419920.1 LysR family transcriptional regulator [Pediococcus acidilactici]KAF0424105.1 LysR family transcriptional regulator [Pediococcus acidilactici]KAF0474198.1 LysR family transcriptional regulator [Pediococcus acidilactici]
MDIRVLRYFVTIAQELNMSRAAELLNVSQPALSRQIADLEDELGVKLFRREHRHLALTQEGHYLLGRAQQIVGLVNKTTYHLQKQDVISGTIEIGAGESSGITPLMETLHQIMRQYPEVRVNLRSGDYEDILAGLDAGLLEFGVLMGYHNLNNYNTLQLPEENRWGVLMRADAQLAEKDVIQPIDLVGRPLITSRQAAQRGTFQIWSGDLFDQLNFVGTYNLIFNGSLLVKTGAVIALTYGKLIDNYTTKNGLVFRPLAPEITEPNTLVWSKNHQLPNLNRLFLDTLQKEIANND